MKLYRTIAVISAGVMMLAGCKEEVPGPDYPAPEPVTEIGKAIVENTSLIASLSITDYAFQSSSGIRS